MDEASVLKLQGWAVANDAVKELWLFGSRAKGVSKPESDVDIGLVLTPPSGKSNWAFGAYIALENEWERQLSEIVGCEVDLQPVVP